MARSQQENAQGPLGVMERPQPDYDAQGIAIGEWTLLPSIGVAANYDDNVFRLPGGSASDWSFETTPILRLQRTTQHSTFGLSANADNFTYARLSRLNLTDWTVSADGQTTIGSAITAAAAVYYGEYHEGFESADILGFQRDQTRFFRGHMDGAVNYQPAAWAITAGASFDEYTWRPTALLDGTRIGNEDRDESLFAPWARFSYNVAPGYQLFARASYDGREFAPPVDRFGFHRSSSGYRVDAGLAVAFDGTLKGEAFVGTLRQTFSSLSDALQDVGGVDYGVDAMWNATPALTVRFAASRALSDILLPGVSLSDDQSVRLSVDWQAMDKVILQGAISLTDSHLIGIPRTDLYPSAGLTARYMINRFVSGQLAYIYTGRQSEERTVRFGDHAIIAGLSFHI